MELGQPMKQQTFTFVSQLNDFKTVVKFHKYQKTFIQTTEIQTWGQSYQTFYGRNLQIFVMS
jgi:alkyl hydroperoxide reductase subunit AhpC